MDRMRLDINAINSVLATVSTDEKLSMLDRLRVEMNDWDVFPLSVVLRGLSADTASVRIKTIEVLGRLVQNDMLPREGFCALWRLAADPVHEVRLALIDALQLTRYPAIYRQDLEEFVPLLHHRSSGIRDTILQLFLFVPHYFDDEFCLRIADSAVSENLDIQATLHEFLEGLGQGYLLKIDREDDSGS